MIKWIAHFLWHRWFLVLLGIVLFGGMWFATPLQPLAQAFPHQVIVASVLFLMSWPLDARAIWKALSRPSAIAVGVFVSFVLLPLTAWGTGSLLREDITMGLMIAASIPCTMVSAAVWSRRAGGNEAVALLVMMITNVTCFVVTPAWIWLATGQSAELDTSFGEMVAELGLIVVLPLLAGQAARRSAASARWASDHKVSIGVIAQLGVLSMIFLGAIHSGRQMADHSSPALSAGHWVAMVSAVVFVHLFMLGAGHGLGHLIGLDRGDRIAVGFAGSQKTLMVGLHLAIALRAPIIPVVAYHVCQLLADTFVADWLKKKSERTGDA